MEKWILLETVGFRGHPLIRARHTKTLEITTEEWLTERGDCIVGVCAESGCSGLSEEVRRAIALDGSRVTVRIVAGPHVFVVKAKGDARLTLTDRHDIVIRRSGYVCGRTLAVMADRSASDMPREMVEFLRSGSARGRMEIEVVPG